MPGLHLVLLEQANRAGVPLALGTRLPWLTGRGHLADVVQERAPRHLIELLADIHAVLGGDAEALAAKRPGNPPTPDLVHPPTGSLIEVDEVQHFTTARLVTLERYPPGHRVGFDLAEYRALAEQWRAKGDKAYAHKVSTDFPRPGGRQAQRAYNDALRDLLAPTFTGRPLIRIPVPGRTVGPVVLDRVRAALAAT